MRLNLLDLSFHRLLLGASGTLRGEMLCADRYQPMPIEEVVGAAGDLVEP
jgi:hypothetical protein